HAVGGHGYGGPLVTAPREMPARVEHGFVLDRAGDKALAAARLQRFGGAAEGEVVRFGAAGSEDNLGRLGANQRRDTRPGRVDGRLGALARGVAAERSV